MDSNRFILNFAPTGIVPTKELNPYTPITLKEIVSEAIEAYNLGASIVHLHARDAQGKPTRDPEVYKRLIGGIRKVCPDYIVCVSLSSRIADNFSRLAPLELGPEKPDMASLTVGSVSLPTGPSINSLTSIMSICDRLNDLEIKPEIEAFEPGMLEFCNYLIKKRKLKAPLYCNIFVGARGASGLSTANLAAFEHAAPPDTFICLAGLGRYQLRAHAVGLTLYDGVRVGLEDNPFEEYTPEKLPARNSVLIERILNLARTLKRTPISAKEFRNILL